MLYDTGILIECSFNELITNNIIIIKYLGAIDQNDRLECAHFDGLYHLLRYFSGHTCVTIR